MQRLASDEKTEKTADETPIEWEPTSATYFRPDIFPDASANPTNPLLDLAEKGADSSWRMDTRPGGSCQKQYGLIDDGRMTEVAETQERGRMGVLYPLRAGDRTMRDFLHFAHVGF